METAEQTLQDERKAEPQESPPTAPDPSGNHKPVPIEPDLDFIRAIRKQGGASVKKCMQCGTCSATCDMSTDDYPFPCRQMAWANWGMKDRLLTAPEVWLCHQCNDCSTRCPRDARPGDVLGAVRQQCVEHFAFPRFLGRWVNRPHCIPLIVGIPAALLTAALFLKDPIEGALGISHEARDKIVFAYSSYFPHWLINSFFGFFTLLVVLVVVISVGRFWRSLRSGAPEERLAAPARGLWSSIGATAKTIILHDKFDLCTKARPRMFTHLLVFFGFIALTLVALWVITARYNPLIRGDFVYPFAVWSPWKILANVGAVALVAGLLLMIRDRLRDAGRTRGGSYFDYALIVTLLVVAGTGLAVELLHYLRLEPHRHVGYFVHLVFVFTLLMYLPYSKLAHMVYRTTTMVFVERFGLACGKAVAPARTGEREGTDDVQETAALA